MELESFRDEQFSSSRVGTIRSKNTQMNLAHNNNVETIPEVNADNEGLSPPKKKGKSLFGGIFSNLNMNDADAMEDGDGPVKENWQFCVYQMKKKKYQIFRNGISDNLNIPVGPEDETLIMCINFREKELKTLLIDKLKVNPIMYYEWMLLSPVDKMFEFNDMATFYNMVINKDDFDESPLILRIIRKQSFAVIIMSQAEGDAFQLTNEIATKFNFKEVK